MTGVLGADVEELIALAATLEDAAAALEQTRATVDLELASLVWTGARSAAHRARWEQEDAGTLRTAAAALTAAAVQLRAEAAEQDDASAAAAGEPMSTALALWREWERRWEGAGHAIGLAPWVGAATTWRDAVRTGWRDTVRHADQWSRAQIGGPVGRALDALSVVGAGVSGWRIGTAITEGDWTRVGTEGAGLGISLAGASQVLALRAAGGVGAAAQAGWWAGSLVYDTWGDTEPMVWIADHVVGPVGDRILGVVDPEARARAAQGWGP